MVVSITVAWLGGEGKKTGRCGAGEETIGRNGIVKTGQCERGQVLAPGLKSCGEASAGSIEGGGEQHEGGTSATSALKVSVLGGSLGADHTVTDQEDLVKSVKES